MPKSSSDRRIPVAVSSSSISLTLPWPLRRTPSVISSTGFSMGLGRHPVVCGQMKQGPGHGTEQGEVHRHGEILFCRLSPSGDLLDGLFKYELADPNNGACLLGDGDELSWGHGTQRWVFPTDRGLGTGDIHAGNINDRLEYQQFLPFQCAVKLLLDSGLRAMSCSWPQ